MTITAKEMKKIWRPKFAAEPEKYYPSKVFSDYGFTKATCPKCGCLYWRRSEKAETCGDSECLGAYGFIGQVRHSNVKATCADVFASFRDHFETTEPVRHTVVRRYPVVARWRDDCEFTAAGIQCYQPFCVTGEVEPPANPLVQAQFCLRFNDLDSIGISGRHYSGFHMLGIQVFNSQNNYKYWKDDIIRYNLQWLEKLGIALDDVTLTADCWAGGGNLGPCVEYFVAGLEVGNMVFMEYKCFADGTVEKLPVQVVDVGIGLERIPWLLSGNITSYITSFPHLLPAICSVIGITNTDLETPAWRQFAKYSCLLNVDEVADINQTWAEISQKCGGSNVKEFQADIERVRDVYIIADHIRSLMVAVQDGALPGNVGGGCNLRNVLRRAFNIAEKRGWISLFDDDKVGVILEAARVDLREIHGQDTFPASGTLQDVILLEKQRWKTTDEQSRQKVQKLLKKTGTLQTNDWVTAVTTFGLDPDEIAKIVGSAVPADLYCHIAEFQERNQVKTQAAEQYALNDKQATDQLYYSVPNGESLVVYSEKNSVQNIINDVEDGNKRRIIVLEKTIFYPTAGGQQNDTGIIKINNVELKIVNVAKTGPCVLHYCSEDIPDSIQIGATEITLHIDAERRQQLMCHHTGAHVLAAACRRVLGPHVWQAGAKKQPEYATLDITHYQSVSYDQQRQIQKECARIIQKNVRITKQTLPKSEAEKRYGFELYQGGVVPGSTVRCVSIEGVDNEACCGTHLESTAAVGLLKIQKTARVSDGVVRIQFVCGEAALRYDDLESGVLEDLKKEWSVDLQSVRQTASKFFDGYKQSEKLVNTLQKELLRLRICHRASGQLNCFKVTESAPTRYLTEVAEILAQSDSKQIEIGAKLIFSGDSFIVYVAASPDIAQLAARLKSLNVKCKQVPLKMPKGVQCNGELILATGIVDKKLLDQLSTTW